MGLVEEFEIRTRVHVKLSFTKIVLILKSDIHNYLLIYDSVQGSLPSAPYKIRLVIFQNRKIRHYLVYFFTDSYSMFYI